LSKAPEKKPENNVVLKRYLMTAIIAAAGFVVSFVLRLVLSGSSDSTSGASFYVNGVLFYTTFYLTPLLFILGAVGTVASLLKAKREKAVQNRGDRTN